MLSGTLAWKTGKRGVSGRRSICVGRILSSSSGGTSVSHLLLLLSVWRVHDAHAGLLLTVHRHSRRETLGLLRLLDLDRSHHRLNLSSRLLLLMLLLEVLHIRVLRILCVLSARRVLRLGL